MAIYSSTTSASTWRRWVYNLLAGVTGFANRVAFWNSSGDLTGDTDLQFDGSALQLGGQGFVSTQTLTDEATINWDMNSGSVAKVTLAGNRTMAAPTNLKDGGTYILRAIQDATGSRTITWNAVFKWAGGTAPTLSTGANSIDVFTFVSDGTNLYGSFLGDFS